MILKFQTIRISFYIENLVQPFIRHRNELIIGRKKRGVFSILILPKKYFRYFLILFFCIRRKFVFFRRIFASHAAVIFHWEEERSIVVYCKACIAIVKLHREHTSFIALLDFVTSLLTLNLTVNESTKENCFRFSFLFFYFLCHFRRVCIWVGVCFVYSSDLVLLWTDKMMRSSNNNDNGGGFMCVVNRMVQGEQ